MTNETPLIDYNNSHASKDLDVDDEHVIIGGDNLITDVNTYDENMTFP